MMEPPCRLIRYPYVRTIILLTTLALALVAVACGDDTGPDTTASATPTASPRPTEATATQGAESPAPGVRCDAPLPEGPIAFAGDVEYVDVVADAPVPTVLVGVHVDRIETTGEAQEWGDLEYVPGELIETVVIETVPSVEAGDCVLVAGQIRRWACAPDCDAAGLVADTFVVAGL